MSISGNSARQIAERVRPRAERILGLQAAIADDLPALSPLVDDHADPDEVIDDAGPLPFRRRDLAAYVDLLTDLASAGEDETLAAALESARVRPLDLLMRGLAASGEQATGDGMADAIANRVRPRATDLRALRYRLANDLRIVPPLIDGADDADLVDEGRGDGVEDMTVGAVRAVMQFAETAIEQKNTEDRARAIDAAVPDALEVS